MQTALIRLPEVKSKTGLSRSELYRREALGLFPKRVPLGARSVGWLAEEVDRWIMERVKASRASQPENRAPAQIANGNTVERELINGN